MAFGTEGTASSATGDMNALVKEELFLSQGMVAGEDDRCGWKVGPRGREPGFILTAGSLGNSGTHGRIWGREMASASLKQVTWKMRHWPRVWKRDGWVL